MSNGILYVNLCYDPMDVGELICVAIDLSLTSKESGNNIIKNKNRNTNGTIQNYKTILKYKCPQLTISFLTHEGITELWRYKSPGSWEEHSDVGPCVYPI